MKKFKKEKIFLIILLILSFLRFFYKIEERAMFEYDQEFLAMEAKKIVIDRKLTLIGAPTSIGGMFIGPFYSYLVALVMWIFKMSPYTIVFLTAFWGVLTIIAIYLVTFNLLGFNAAFFASLTALLSFSFLDGIPPLVQPLALTSLLIFWSTLKLRKKKNYLLLTAFLIGWSLHLHFSAAFFPFLVILYIFFTKTKIELDQIKKSALILLIFLLPIILFETRHQFFMTHNFINFILSKTSVKMGISEGFVHTLKINLEHLGGLLFTNNYLIQIILVLTILFFSLRTLNYKNNFLFKAVVLWLLTPFLIFAFYRGHIIPYYFTLQEIIFFVVCGVFFAKVWEKKYLKILLFVFLIVFLKENFNLWFSWKTTRSLKNKLIALRFIKDQSLSQPIYLSHTMEPGIDGGFNYLEWYLKINKKNDRNLPIYTLIAPSNWYEIKSDYVFGDYGVCLPKNK